MEGRLRCVAATPLPGAHLTRFRSILAAALLLGSQHGAAASLADILDSIRAYDLNDYALGIALSASESPYIGGENSVIVYPYLTSFQHHTLTDDWFLVSQGDLGFRWISDAGWEFGAVGRVQTLGLGNSTDPALLGLDDRNWSVEVAPMIGYRGWPVQVNLKTYFEVLGRHGGNQTNLSLLLPLAFDHGYLVPSIEAIHRSSAYTDYYFGVAPNEATPDRPVYEAGSSNAARIGFSLGLRLTENWLLAGSARLQFLDDEVTDSPISGTRDVWSASIGLAYNADVFQPRASSLVGKRQPAIEFRVTAFAATMESRINRANDAGNPGDVIDLEDQLNIDDSNTVLQLDTIWRLNPYHRLELGYHQLSRSGVSQLGQDLSFGNTVFATDSTVQSTIESDLIRIGYGYSLINDDQKEIGVTAGVHISDIEVQLLSLTDGSRERSEVATPLPVIGAFASVELGQQSTLGARANVFALEFDRLEGAMVLLNIEWQRRLGDRVTAGIGYNYYYTKLESRDADASGTLVVTHHGPTFSVSANFR